MRYRGRSATRSCRPSPHRPHVLRPRAADARTPDHPGAHRTTRSPDTPAPLRMRQPGRPTIGNRAGARASTPDTSPRQGSCQRRALSRAGRTFSRKICLRQIRRSPPQHLVLLLQQSDPFARFAQLRTFRPGLTGFGSVVDGGALQPLLQRHRVNTEILRDLLDRHTRLTTTGDTNDIVTELSGIRLRHNNILPARPPGQADSDVNNQCSRPQGHPELVPQAANWPA